MKQFSLISTKIAILMALNIGQIIKGKYRTYRLVDALKVPTVFKARVLPDLGVKSTLYVFYLSLSTLKKILIYTYKARS